MTTSATCPVCGNPQADGLLDDACTTRLERDLGDVPSIVRDLEITVSRQARIGSGGKGGPAHERTPIHLGAVEAADVLTNTLTTWARDLMSSGVVPPHPSPARAAMIVLLGRIDQIRRHPAAAELVDEITDAIRQARRVVDRPADRVYLGQCYFHDEESDQTCYEDVYASPGAFEVRCKVCGITHEVAERRAAMMAKAEDMLFTASDASKFLGQLYDQHITEDRIGSLLRRGTRLQYRPGTKTFRLGDLLDILRADSKERAEKRSA